MRTLEGPIKNFILKVDFFRVSTSSIEFGSKIGYMDAAIQMERCRELFAQVHSRCKKKFI